MRPRSRPGLIPDHMVRLGARQARRRRPQGTSVPMRRRAAPCRDRAHGRPREAEADAGPQGQQGTAGARTPRVKAGLRPTTAAQRLSRVLRQGRRRGKQGTKCRCKGEHRRAVRWVNALATGARRMRTQRLFEWALGRPSAQPSTAGLIGGSWAVSVMPISPADRSASTTGDGGSMPPEAV